jgi:ankyrin repeat protein
MAVFGLNRVSSISLSVFRKAFAGLDDDLSPGDFDVKFIHVTPPGERLLEASANGLEENVSEMVVEGANPDYVRASDGATALYMASTQGHVRIVRTLLAESSLQTINHETHGNSKTALLKAAVRGHTEIVKMLLDALADPNVGKAYDKATPLYAAAHAGKVESMQLLIAAGANLETVLEENSLITLDRDAKYYGTTALIVASYFDKPEAVKVLLNAGANPDAKTLQGKTALDVATSVACNVLLTPATNVSRSGVFEK